MKRLMPGCCVLACLLGTWFHTNFTLAQEQNKPYFTDEFIQDVQSHAPYPLVYSEKEFSGIHVPMINGRGIWGVSIRNGTGKPLEQLKYEMAWLHAQGANYVRTSGFLGNDPSTILPAGSVTVPMEHFQAIFQTMRDYGIGFSLNHANIVKWQLPGWIDMNRVSNVEDMVLTPSGKKETQHGTGNIYSPIFRQAVIDWQVNAATALADNPAFHGIQVSNEPWVKFAPRNPEALGDFRLFCRQFFSDDSPASDTNGDGLTFNKTMQTHFAQWSDVTTFNPLYSIDDVAITRDGIRSPDWRETFGSGPQARIMRLWLGDLWGRRYQQEAAHAVHQVRDDLYVCASTNGRLDGAQQDLATYAAQPDVRALFRNTYDDPGQSFMASAVAHAYGKPAWHTEFNVYWQQNPKRADLMLAATIPYISGYEWYAQSWHDDSDVRTDWGAKFNIVNDWATKPTWAGKTYEQWDSNTQIGKPASFDERWEAFPKFAPFISYFNGMQREQDSGVLWINGGPAFLTTRGMIFDAHATSDQALILHPDALDLSRYKLAIYFTPHADHLMTSELYEHMMAYVRQGGTLIASAHLAGMGHDLRGTPNADYFRKGLQPAKGVGNLLAIYGDQKGHISYLQPYLIDPAQKKRVDGPLIKYADDPVVFRFPLPEGSRSVLVRDIQVPWDEGGKIEAAYSPDGVSWTQLPAENKLFTANNHHYILSVSRDLNNADSVYLRYNITRTAPAKWYGSTHAGHVSYIGMTGTHLRGLMVMVTDQDDYSGQCTASLGDATIEEWGVLPMYEADGSVDYQTLGQIKLSHGRQLPLAFVQNIGKGRLVLVNDPEIFAFNRMGAAVAPQERRERLALLNAIARQTAGVDVPAFDGLHVYEGPQAVLANYFEDDPFILTTDVQKYLRSEVDRKPNSHRIDVKALSSRMVVFDAFEHRTIDGPYVEARNGRLVFTDAFERPWSFHLWITKPFGQPVVLYTDGTLRQFARIDDGQWDQLAKTLKLELTDVAYISSPRPAKAIMADRTVTMDYNTRQCLLTLKGPGLPTRVTVNFE